MMNWLQDHIISDMQSLSTVDQLPPSFQPEGTDKILPMKRPDCGRNSIKSCRILVNHYPIKFNPEGFIMHYDVDIKPHGATKNGQHGKITKSDLRMIRNKLLSDGPQHPMWMTAYDGEKNIFSAEPLPTGNFTVEISEGEDSNKRSFMFTIKLVNELKFCKLKEYISGNLLLMPRDTLQGMDLVMKENPARRLISVGRSFFHAEFNPRDDLGYGIAASRGFQHSLKPTFQGLALCLDYSVLAFRKRVPVIDFLKEHIRGFNLNDFGRFKREAEDALIGLKVTVTHRRTKQKYTIACLTNVDTRHLSFKLDDPEGKASPREICLVDYFRDKYDKTIRFKDIPCLDVGKNNRKNYVPMEFCVLAEGQRYPKEQLERKDKQAAVLLKNISLARANDRKSMICQMVQSEYGPCGGGIVQKFRMEVDTNMTTVEGRVIGPPELRLGDSNGRVNKIKLDREKCQWNLVGKSVVEGKSVERWAVLDFTAKERFNVLDANYFIPTLIKRCQNLGIDMGEPLSYECTKMSMFSNVNALHEVLDSINEGAKHSAGGQLQILLCVMTKRDPGYKHLKWISETQIGIVTQCCLSSSRLNDQYFANLALKINAKLGGSNVELISRFPCFEGRSPVMFVGADVNHPAASNKTCPSIAAVVATMNWPAANCYAARVCPQAHRKEKIVNFGNMCAELVDTYAKHNKVKPEKIVVFRDGVSEGQFDMVLNEELVDLKKAIQTKDYCPTITLIVARKRHPTRLFPESPRDGGAAGNVPPGTVVDTKIVHPFEFDFYLCSHYGSLGTSKPTHYHVLWDEHGFTSDQLQQLIYNLCFTFARCTKPVSLVPPVYYADLVAYRGRMYQEALMEGGLPRGSRAPSQSPAPASAALSAGPSFSERTYRLHSNIEDAMFFV
ncbi:protein argonaute 2-like [Malania oleifera]|uniref:protein argonaute 2-like n=1 Tax=Malania oleifera TaxID=397392 RepID=UPI0025AE3C06|nr:protein argonaute 2-like [Malania oleifera]